ncbi:MAG: glycosyltransferase [Propionibacteriaceae bacterium]|nr:glycosyltransferase [Propionibacteriaceae bacterium]
MVSGVSVIIACHNGAERIGACLDALAGQDWPGDIETIVVDDRSTDDTAATAVRHGARVIATRGTQGPAAARNLGITVATHPVIAFTDDDALPEPGWLAALVAVLEQTGAGAVAGATVPSDDDHLLCRYLAVNNPLAPLERGIGAHRSALRRLTDYLRGVAGLGPQLSGVRPIYAAGTVNLAVRAETLAELDGFDADFGFSGEDQDLCRRLLAHDPDGLWFAPEAVVRHVFDPRLGDTLRRSRAYALGNAALHRKHPEIGRIVFPIPVLWLVATLALAAHRPRRAWLPTAAIAAAYPRYLRHAATQPNAEALAYPYLQFLSECAANVGAAEGMLADRARRRPKKVAHA